MKKIISVIIVLVLMFSLAIPAAASDVPTQVEIKDAEGYAAGISPRWEQTEWVFRVNNGVVEQRLWSITFGRWLTDWHPAW